MGHFATFWVGQFHPFLMDHFYPFIAVLFYPSLEGLLFRVFQITTMGKLKELREKRASVFAQIDEIRKATAVERYVQRNFKPIQK
jgi:hypothetical protein